MPPRARPRRRPSTGARRDAQSATRGDRGRHASASRSSGSRPACDRVDDRAADALDGVVARGRGRGRARRRPAASARTAPSSTPTVSARPRISSASVTTSPSKPSSSRSRPVEHAARLSVAGSVVERRHDDVRGHDRLTPASIAARNGTQRGLEIALGARQLEVRVLRGVAVAREVLRAGGDAAALQARRRTRRTCRATSSGSEPNERMPITGLPGFEFTSAHGSEVEVDPGAGAERADRGARPRPSRATSSTTAERRGSRGTSCRSPTSSRVTSPPSSSVETSTAGFSARSAAVSAATCSTSRTFQPNRHTPPSPSASRRRTHSGAS